MLWFRAGQMSTALLLNITADKLPEEAEAFVLRLLPDTVQGGAEVDEPMEVSLANHTTTIDSDSTAFD
jgi:G-protein coupled receptor 98